ncbi:MAG: MFS transporter [Chloroflexi bacterium]|jgi:MFS family permease|uniref:MFS transporter n=1 Tax=Candidatus Flexifilum breve TaxID=3140694 RepID=UPI003136A08D|nr:MFS transporter [Chloroflexota bacterium]
MAVTPHDPYAALRFRDFRLLFSGRFVAQVGEMMVSVAVGWELYDRTGDAFALGLVGLVQVIPVMLLSMPAGYIVDRYDRKLITLWSQVVLIVCSLALAGLSLTRGPLPLLYVVLAVIGAARAFNNPAEGALTPQTVPPEHYFNATTWSSMVWQTSAITGPAIGGFIIGLAGNAAAVYMVNAAAGAVLVIVLLMLRLKPQTYTPTDEPPLKALRAGWHFVRNTQVILGSLSLDMFAVLFGGATFLLPIYAKDILHVDATGLGFLRAAPSIGALMMAAFLSRRPPFQRAGRTLLWAVAGFGVATIAFGLSTSFWVSLLMLALTGALDNISVVVRHTLVLTHTPDDMRGRVNAVNSTFIGASNELGGFESGLAAALLGPVGAVVFGGFGTLAVVGAVAWLSPELRRMGALHKSYAPEAEVAAAAEQSVST